MISELLNSLQDIVFKVTDFLLESIMRIVQFLLNPIDNIITSFLPGVAYILDKIGAFFNYISGFIPWVISYFGLDSTLLNLIVTYFVFSITVSITLHTIKFGLKWYRALH